MIKKMAWDAFKNTGDINTFLEYKEIENYSFPSNLPEAPQGSTSPLLLTGSPISSEMT